MGSTFVVEQLSFSMFPSILTFEFDLILGLFLSFVVEQLSFSMLPSILTFDFDLILGSFLTFWGPNGLFLGLG